MTGNDNGEGKEKVLNSGGRSFQRRGAVTDMALLRTFKYLGSQHPPQFFCDN